MGGAVTARAAATLLAASALLLASAPGAGATATAATGDAAQDAGSPTGGTRPGRLPARRPARDPNAGRPVLTSFSAGPARFYLHGAPARIRFAIADRSRSVRVRLDVFAGAARRPARRIDLGARATGARHTVSLDGQGLPEGALRLRLVARDPGGRALRRTARASGLARLELRGHRFPIAGPFSYGSPYGQPRPNGPHAGLDLPSPQGTPLVAPRGGVVKVSAYQAEGAGNYVVLKGEGEPFEYVFMHMAEGSVVVRQGQRVRTGELIGRIGSTGRSTGPHLHFEMWDGPWFAGGRRIDPTPHVRAWDAWS